jgi:hypothetical protein
LPVTSEVDETSRGSQQQLCDGVGASRGLAGAGFSFGMQQRFASRGFSAECATGSQQHQPIGVAITKLHKCTRIRWTHGISLLLARARRFVKCIMKEGREPMRLDYFSP